MWEILNFCILIIILIIILVIILLFIFYYYKIRSYIDDAVNHIGSLIPTFNEYEYTDINYDLIKDLELSTGFTRSTAMLLCHINMSSYNIFGEFSPRLPDDIEYIQNINNTGFVYETKIKGRQISIFSFRGTKTGDDVITDLDSVQTELNINGYPNNILVHRGFYRLWSPYRDEIKKYIKERCTKRTVFLVTGHSLGCASALFTALTIAVNHSNIQLYMFAPPRVGNHHFINQLNKEVPDNYAIINIPDIIPNLPPVTLSTIGNTWLYENFTNRYVLDYQLGSITLNHRLDTYACGLDDSQELCREPIWKKVPILVNS